MGNKLLNIECCNCRGFEDPDSYVLKVWESLKICNYEFAEFESNSLNLLQKINTDKKKVRVLKTNSMSPKDYLLSPAEFEKIAETYIIDINQKTNPYYKIHLSFLNMIVNEKKSNNEQINYINVQFTFFSFFKVDSKFKKYQQFFKLLLYLGNTNALSWVWFQSKLKNYIELNLKDYFEFVKHLGDFGETGLTKEDFDAQLKERFNDYIIDEIVEEIYKTLYDYKQVDNINSEYIVLMSDFDIMFEKKSYIFEFGKLRDYTRKKQENCVLSSNKIEKVKS